MRKMMQYRPQANKKQQQQHNFWGCHHIRLSPTMYDIYDLTGIGLICSWDQVTVWPLLRTHPINKHNTAICWLLWLPENYFISLINMSTYCLYEHNLYLCMCVVTGELRDGGKGVVFTNEISIYDVHTHGYSVNCLFSLMFILRGKRSMVVHDSYQPYMVKSTNMQNYNRHLIMELRLHTFT